MSENYQELIYNELKLIRQLLEQQNNQSIHINQPVKLQSDAGDIEKYLIENQIEYIKEFEINPFKDVILYCDFYLPDYNLVIEYDGEQHFFIDDKFNTDKDPIDVLKKQQRLDKIKDGYCKDKEINLVRIPFTYSPEQIQRLLSTISRLTGIKIIMPYNHKINSYDSKHKSNLIKDNYYLYNSKIDEFAELYAQEVNQYDISPLLVSACYEDFIMSYYPSFKKSLFYKDELQRKYQFDFETNYNKSIDMGLFEKGYHVQKLRGLI